VLPQFVARGFVDDSLRPAFRSILERAGRLRRSSTALLVMIALVAVATFLGFSVGQDTHELAWESSAGGPPHSARAGSRSYRGRSSAGVDRLAGRSACWPDAANRADLRLAPTHRSHRRARLNI
jgi:hypothetical protein